MLTVQLAQAFSDIPDVPVPQLDTNVVSIGQQLSQAEASLNAAFAAFQAASAAAPNQSIPPELIQAYTDARAGFVAAVQVWIDGYNQTPVEQRDPNAPNAVPVLPPEISVLSSGFGGAGILPSQVVVKYGPMGRDEQSRRIVLQPAVSTQDSGFGWRPWSSSNCADPGPHRDCNFGYDGRSSRKLSDAGERRGRDCTSRRRSASCRIDNSQHRAASVA